MTHLINKLYCWLLGHHYMLSRATLLAGQEDLPIGKREWRLTYRCQHCGREKRENVPCMVSHLAKTFGIREEDL